MSTDVLAGIVAILVGGACAGMGLYAYLGKGARDLFRRASNNSYGLFGKAGVVFLLPGGLGILLIGIAFVVGKNAATEPMVVAGLGLLLVGWLLFFVHPSFAQPKWMRNRHKG